ncbi:threonine/serine exporter family protein, partial [Desulfovibrio sp. OttesenSCG-928-G15]|nr:threonine/serine exporter family protein [Desulfovibrio sp. OttesenSCG-928-G15]
MTAALFAILEDAFFAALAGLGFAVAANPPKRILPAAAFLAAIGHAFRFGIMEYAGVSIATASLLAGLLVGVVGIVITIAMRVPSEFFCFPALLPMIPGLYAYKAILSI